MSDMLLKAKAQNFDVFNTLDYMDYTDILPALKYGEGDGLLYYYLFNWRVKTMPKDELGMTFV